MSEIHPFHAHKLQEAIRMNRGPIELHDVEILDPVVVHSCDFDYRIELRRVVFRSLVDLRDITFRRTIDFRKCEFHGGLVMDGTLVAGSLLMDGACMGKEIRDARGRSARLQLLRVHGDLLARGLNAAGSVDLTRADIGGHLEIAALDADHPSLIGGRLQLSTARIGGHARLNGLVLNGRLAADGVRVGGNLTLGPFREDYEMDTGPVLVVTQVAGDIDLTVARVVGEVSLTCARIGGLVNLQTAEIRGGLFGRCKHGFQPVFTGPVYARGARIHGTVDFNGAKLHGGLWMEGASVVGTIFLSDGWMATEGGEPGTEKHPGGPELALEVGADVTLSHARIRGTLQMLGARVNGSFVLDVAMITGKLIVSRSKIEKNLDVRSAVIRGGLQCRCRNGERPSIGGSVLARGARISSGAIFVGADIGEKVDLAETVISGSVEFRRGCAEKLDGCDTVIGNTPTTVRQALELSGTVIAGSLEAAGVYVGGDIRLTRANVHGWVDLTGAETRGRFPDPPTAGSALGAAPDTSLHAVGMCVGDSFRLGGAQVRGNVDLRHARIGGGLFTGTLLSDDSGDDARGAQVEGSLLLGAANVVGTTDFRGTRIGGELSLERASIEGKLRCRLVAIAAGATPAAVAAVTQCADVNLRDATVHSLDFDGNDPKSDDGFRASGMVKLEGCTFQELSIPGGNHTAVLDAGGAPFHEGTYLAMERWLRDRGNDQAAEKVYLRMREKQRESLSPLAKVGHLGVQLARRVALAFPWLILASVVGFIITTVVFSSPRSVVEKHSEVPTPMVARAIGKGAAERPHPAQWGWSNAVFFAAHTHLPMLSLPVGGDWDAAPDAMWEPALTVGFDAYAFVVSLLSYAVIPLMIGGIATTWLERRGRS